MPVAPQGAQSADGRKEHELRRSARSLIRTQGQRAGAPQLRKERKPHTVACHSTTDDDDNDNPSNYARKGDGITDVDLTTTTLLSTR
ncbi:hypothetical protein Tco_0225744 [Tanacetum coccineum]